MNKTWKPVCTTNIVIQNLILKWEHGRGEVPCHAESPEPSRLEPDCPSQHLSSHLWSWEDCLNLWCFRPPTLQPELPFVKVLRTEFSKRKSMHVCYVNQKIRTGDFKSKTILCVATSNTFRNLAEISEFLGKYIYQM